MKPHGKYICAGRKFDTLDAAIDYANFIAKISGIIVAIEAE